MGTYFVALYFIFNAASLINEFDKYFAFVKVCLALTDKKLNIYTII